MGQKKTVLHKIISDFKEIHNRGIVLTNKGLLMALENSLENERQQIADAFEEGQKYEKSDSPSFDYRTTKYINWTYETYI